MKLCVKCDIWALPASWPANSTRTAEAAFVGIATLIWNYYLTDGIPSALIVAVVVGEKKARRQFCTAVQGKLRRMIKHKLKVIVREKSMVPRFRNADETPVRQ